MEPAYRVSFLHRRCIRSKPNFPLGPELSSLQLILCEAPSEIFEVPAGGGQQSAHFFVHVLDKDDDLSKRILLHFAYNHRIKIATDDEIKSKQQPIINGTLAAQITVRQVTSRAFPDRFSERPFVVLVVVCRHANDIRFLPLC